MSMPGITSSGIRDHLRKPGTVVFMLGTNTKGCKPETATLFVRETLGRFGWFKVVGDEGNFSGGRGTYVKMVPNMPGAEDQAKQETVQVWRIITGGLSRHALAGPREPGNSGADPTDAGPAPRAYMNLSRMLACDASNLVEEDGQLHTDSETRAG